MAGCRSNFVGIPRPGQFAFTLRRDILNTLIEGLDDENASAELTSDWLRIESIRRQYALRDVWSSIRRSSDRVAGIRVRGYAEKSPAAQRRARYKKIPACVLKQISQLEKWLQRSSYCSPRKPEKSFFDWLHDQEKREEQEARIEQWRQEGSAFRSRAEERADILSWYKDKSKRRDLAKIQTEYLTNRIDLTQFYKRVRAAGFTIEPLSKQPKSTRDKGPEWYAKHFRGGKVAGLAEWEPWEHSFRRCKDYNDSLRENRLRKEKLAKLKADVERFERGESVEFEVGEE